MKTYTIAAILVKNNVSHATDNVAGQLQKTYDLRYGINLKTEAASVASDTCKATANVADFLDADQHYCEMHLVNLTMGYGLGLKENKKTDKFPNEKGGVKKIKHIMTPGEAFPEGDRLGKTSRKCVIFFTSSPQRKNKLETQRMALDLPLVDLANYPETRTAYLM